MTTNTTTALIIGLLAPALAAACIAFKLPLSADQQAQLLAGLAVAITAGATIWASVVHHSNAKVAVARAQNVGSIPAPADLGDADSVVATQAKDAKAAK